MKISIGFDGEYTIMSKTSIEHRKKDGTRKTYFSAFEIQNLSDRMEVERIIKEMKVKRNK
ncbi:MAG: hypothetical protein Q7J98_08515 [Kiritimatiellia bacterium]|nr:hypothetical protein [Kiritimatiellia bacterium]